MGKVLFKLVAKSVDINFRICREISAEVVLTVELADNYRNLFDARLSGDQALDLTELNTQTSQLDLVVKSAED